MLEGESNHVSTVQPPLPVQDVAELVPSTTYIPEADLNHESSVVQPSSPLQDVADSLLDTSDEEPANNTDNTVLSNEEPKNALQDKETTSEQPVAEPESLLDTSDEDPEHNTMSSDQEPKSSHQDTETTPKQPIAEPESLLDTSDEDSKHNKVPSDQEPNLNTETTPQQPIAESENIAESTGTASDAPAKESLLALYLRAMKKKPSKCFFPHCKNVSLTMTHLAVMHLKEVIDLEIPTDLNTYKCYACPLKFEARSSYLAHLKYEEWKQEPPSFLEKYTLDSKEVKPPEVLDLNPYINNVRAQGSAKTTPPKAKDTFKCTDCPEEFPTSLGLMHHKSAHSYAQVSDDDDNEHVEKKGSEEKETTKGKSKSDGFYPCQICGKKNPSEINLNAHLVTHFREQILEKYPPIVGEKNILTCSINGCKKSFTGSNPKHNYLRHVGVVHKFFKEHLEKAMKKYHEDNEGAKRIGKPSLGTKRKASSPKTATSASKKQKVDEPVAGTSGNQRRRKDSASTVRINIVRSIRICQLCPKGFPNVSEFRRHLAIYHFRYDWCKLPIHDLSY